MLRSCLPGSGWTSVCQWDVVNKLLAQSKYFSVLPFWFSPSSPGRGVSQQMRSDLPDSWGQVTAIDFFVFSIHHHKSAALAHQGTRSGPLLQRSFLAHESQHWCTMLFCPRGWTSHLSLLNVMELHWLISLAWLAHSDWQHLPRADQIFPLICCRPWTCSENQMKYWSLSYWNQVTQRSRGISVSGDFQILTRQAPQQPDLTFKLDVLWAGGWHRWPLEVLPI